MFFIRGMVTGKWICFYAVRKVTDNGYRLGEVAEHKTSLELQTFKLR